MRQVPLGARRILTIVVVGAAIAISPIVHGQSIQPFHLEQIVSALNLDTGVWNPTSKATVIARRGDGTTAQIESIGPAGNRLRVRDVLWADGRAVSVFDDLQRKITWPPAVHDGLMMQRSRLAAPQCVTDAVADDTGEASERVLRLDTVHDQTVVVSESSTGRFVDRHDDRK